MILIVLIAIIGDAILTKSQKPVATPTPVSKIASYKNITPGVSSKTDLDRVLGSPLRTITTGGSTELEYKSTNVNRPHIAIEENGVIVLIREIVNSIDKKFVDDVTSAYGAPQYILYNQDPNNAFRLYVYPANGIAYIAHPDGTLLEIWYFAPTTIDSFIQKWGQGYSQASPPPNQFY